MALRVLLADADGTLFDFHRGEAVAIGETFRRFGIPATPGNLATYSRVNHAQWLKLERGETVEKIQYVEETYFDTTMNLWDMMQNRNY